MVIGTALGWGNGATIALAVVLAFFFGYLLTLRPLLAHELPPGCNARVARHGIDTVMEIVDNGIMLVIPGAMLRASQPAVLGQSCSLARVAAVGLSRQPVVDRAQRPCSGPCASFALLRSGGTALKLSCLSLLKKPLRGVYRGGLWWEQATANRETRKLVV